MARARRPFFLGAVVVGLLMATAGVATLLADASATDALLANRRVPFGAIPLGVLGDSGSHSYHDRLAFPSGTAERGGRLQARTFNWTEILARLRPNEIDSGPWVEWGHAGTMSWLRERVGLEGHRSPRKQDRLYNFANSGARCADLMRGRFRQVQRLVAMMNREPAHWVRGVVVIRIGLNDWAAQLDAHAREPDGGSARALGEACATDLRDALSAIRSAHPRTRVLVVGIVNEADDPAYSERFRSQAESANLRRALDRFNDSLKQVAASAPNTAWFDDQAWFERRWGSRDVSGLPAYKTVRIAGFDVTNTAGDEPSNALLADHHPGLVWNALWAQSLVERMRGDFALPLTPIGDAELADFVKDPGS